MSLPRFLAAAAFFAAGLIAPCTWAEDVEDRIASKVHELHKKLSE